MTTNKQLLIVKYGSSSVTNDGGVDYERLEQHVAELVKLREQYGLLLVSSGAIAVGRAFFARNHAGDTPHLQTLATIGSGEIFTAWQRAFAAHGLIAGQLLITHREIDEPDEGGMLRTVLQRNLDSDVISIVNENDALSDAEIAALSYGGDNDGLAAHVANAMGASRLLLLTEVDGLLDNNGELIATIGKDDAESALNVAGKPGAKGRGGMESKVKAALSAANHGVTAHVASSDAELGRVLAGELGTTFYASEMQYA